ASETESLITQIKDFFLLTVLIVSAWYDPGAILACSCATMCSCNSTACSCNNNSLLAEQTLGVISNAALYGGSILPTDNRQKRRRYLISSYNFMKTIGRANPRPSHCKKCFTSASTCQRFLILVLDRQFKSGVRPKKGEEQRWFRNVFP